MEDLQKYKPILIKIFKRRQITGTPQPPVSLASHITVVVGGLWGEKKLELHYVLHNIKWPTRAKRSSCFLPNPLVGSAGSCSLRCIPGCMPRPQWEQEKEIKRRVPLSPDYGP